MARCAAVGLAFATLLAAMLLSGCGSPGEPIPFVDMGELLGCIDPSGFEEGDGLVIEDEERYATLLASTSPSPRCEAFTLSEIDFSSNILLGQYAQAGGCSIFFDKRVVRDDRERTLTYRVTVDASGACDMLGMSMNWIMVPRPDEGHEVRFERR